MAGGDAIASRRQKGGVAGFIQRNLLTMLTIAGVLGGTALGCILRTGQESWDERSVMYLQFPGELFLRMLKALIIPLLVASIVSAIGGLDLSMSGRIGVRAIIFYMTTTVCAVILGIILVTVVRPGVGAEVGATKAPSATRNVLTADTLLDLIR
jgi:Na+/H+-dicarboxylate symporter